MLWDLPIGILFCRIQYRAKVSWQFLDTRTPLLDPRSSKLENFEYRVSSRELRVSSREFRVSSRELRVSRLKTKSLALHWFFTQLIREKTEGKPFHHHCVLHRTVIAAVVLSHIVNRTTLQYRAKVSWQSLNTRTTRLDPRSSKLENFEYRVLSRELRVLSREFRVSS